jgi:hypothetical protein
MIGSGPSPVVTPNGAPTMLASGFSNPIGITMNSVSAPWGDTPGKEAFFDLDHGRLPAHGASAFAR